MYSEHLRYLGALGLLAECAVHVPSEIRESIEAALDDAAASNPHLTWRRVVDRVEIDIAAGGAAAGRGLEASAPAAPAATAPTMKSMLAELTYYQRYLAASRIREAAMHLLRCYRALREAERAIDPDECVIEAKDIEVLTELNENQPDYGLTDGQVFAVLEAIKR